MARRVMTIEDDDPVIDRSEEEEEDEVHLAKKAKKGQPIDIDPDFAFETNDVEEAYKQELSGTFSEPERVPLQNRIDLLLEKRKQRLEEAKKAQAQSETSGAETASDGLDDDDDDDDDNEEGVLMDKASTRLAPPLTLDDIEDSDDEIDEEEEQLRKEFFSETPEVDVSKVSSFADLNLNRAIQVGLTQMKLEKPTPIQARAIPIGLMAKDLCACASTGSGKTLAFLVPALDRLSYKPPGPSVTRMLVLAPTRELAQQVYKTAAKLANFLKSGGRRGSNINCALIMGGNKLQADMKVLKERPDVIVATPGRLVDHLNNTPGFDLSAVEILILDEADRLLEFGFEDHLKAIVAACKPDRQTMLFSATMTDKVADLMRVTLKRPCRLDLTVKKKATENLVQEFVRIRPGHEDKREAIVLSLCKRTFKERVMVFVRSKKHAHRLRIVFGLADLPAAELHGSLTQQQRLESLARFQNNEVEFLICSDLAGRGLDLPSVKTVINLYMPNTVEQYIHRVGRTARAGRSGRSISFVGQDERKLMRQLYKQNKDAMRNRTVKPEVVAKFKSYIDGLADDITEILRQEGDEAELLRAELEERKLRNMVTHHDEIMSRPARQWIQTKQEKKQAEELSRRAHEGDKAASLPSQKLKEERKQALIRKLRDKQKAVKEKRQPLSAETKEQLAVIRQAKRERKPKRLRVLAEDGNRRVSRARQRAEQGFNVDLPDTSRRAKEQGTMRKSTLLKRKSSSKKEMLSRASEQRKAPSRRGNKFKSKMRHKRR